MKNIKFILTEEGLGGTHSVTKNKVYESHKTEGNTLVFMNDSGYAQRAVPDWYLEIPEGHFVGCLDSLDGDFTGLLPQDYTLGKPYIVKASGVHEKRYVFLDDIGDKRMPFHQAVRVIADPWGVSVTAPVNEEPPHHMVTEYNTIRLIASVCGLYVGNHYEVEGININGSYIVSDVNGKRTVPRDKAVPVASLGTKEVPCRCPTYHGIGPQGCPTGPEEAKGTIGVSDSALGRPVPFLPLIPTAYERRAIKKQKEIAKELLIFSMIMDHQAMIAGGAPRNWVLGQKGNDIDIFLRVPNKAPESHLKNVLEAFGVTKLFNLTTHAAPGKPRNCEERQHRDTTNTQTKIRVVFEGEYRGEKVQFIFLEPRTHMGVSYARKHFDTSINMLVAGLGNDNELFINNSPVFEDAIKSGVIFVYPNGNPYGDNHHLEKIHQYFPEAPLVSHVHHDEVMRNPAKAYTYAKDWEDFTQDGF